MMKDSEKYDYPKRGARYPMWIRRSIPGEWSNCSGGQKEARSPVISKEKRPGRSGELFTIYKFSSMLHADKSQRIVTDEHRITAFVRKLWATSLNELPSLVNIFKGGMSRVGPRPLLVHYTPLYTKKQARRHEVPSGITGLAPVNGRNDVEWETKSKLDVRYVDRRSLKPSILILWRTLAAVANRRGINKAGYELTDQFGGPPHVS